MKLDWVGGNLLIDERDGRYTEGYAAIADFSLCSFTLSFRVGMRQETEAL